MAFLKLFLFPESGKVSFVEMVRPQISNCGKEILSAKFNVPVANLNKFCRRIPTNLTVIHRPEESMSMRLDEWIDADSIQSPP